MAEKQLAQAASLKGATLPDGTKYTGEAPTEARQAEADKPEPAPAETEAQDDEGQTDQPGNVEAGGGRI